MPCNHSSLNTDATLAPVALESCGHSRCEGEHNWEVQFGTCEDCGALVFWHGNFMSCQRVTEDGEFRLGHSVDFVRLGFVPVMINR